MSDINSASSWEVARDLVTTHLDLSTNALTTCVRVLHRDHLKGTRELSISSKYLLQTLIRGRSIQAPIFYALGTFYPEDAEHLGKMTTRSISKIFTPGDLSVILAMSLIYRRLQKWTNLEGFKSLNETMHIFADIGGFVGQAIPSVGLRLGILIGAIRHLSHAVFIGVDEQIFLKHRRNVRLKNQFFNLQSEYKVWGTTHLHIASHIIQILGLGLDDAKTIVEAFISPHESGDPAVEKYRTLQIWIEALYTIGAPPEMTHKGEFYPTAFNLAQLIERSKDVKEEGASFRFMSRKRDDCTKEKTPALFEGVHGDEGVDDIPDNPPEDLMNELSPEELEELKKLRGA